MKIDRELYGKIEGVTDHEYYTNGFHSCLLSISAYDKIRLEAPYHAFTNGGHISYVEMDGDQQKNLPAFEKLFVLCMMHKLDMVLLIIL